MSSSSKIRFIDAAQPQPDSIENAATTISNGGIVIFPTRGLYGLGADARRPEAVKRVFDIKRRPLDKPLPILVADRRQVAEWIPEIPPVAQILMDAFWPGKMTLVFKSAHRLPAVLTAGRDRLGIRLPGHPSARALVEAAGCPITATSANLSGAPGCHRVTDVPADLLDRVDLVLDAGQLAGGAGSTVVDVSGGSVVIIREGAVSKIEIEKVLRSES